MISATEALQRLKTGNARFVAERSASTPATRDDRHALVEGQAPFAVILGCSDSRVPVEIIFDQGFGDLFVIRVAGNIVAPSQIASVEFAVENFGTPLVVVMGHSRCGAVAATLNELQRPETDRAPANLRSIIGRIRPSVQTVLDGGGDPSQLLQRAVRANARAAANHLRHSSDILEPLVQSGELQVVAAEYALETGAVEFFDGAD